MILPRLDRRIQLQRQSSTLASDGTQSSTWTTFATVYAKTKDVPSTRRGEIFSSAQHSDTLFTEFTIRYMAGLDGSERIVDDRGSTYNVYGVPSEVGRREYSVIIGERGAVKS